MARWRGGSTRWVLPVALTAFLAIAWLERSFELDTGELLAFLVTSSALVSGLAVAAAALSGPRRFSFAGAAASLDRG